MWAQKCLMWSHAPTDKTSGFSYRSIIRFIFSCYQLSLLGTIHHQQIYYLILVFILKNVLYT